MEPKDTISKVEEQGQSKLIDSNNELKNVKSHYIIQLIFEYMTERKYLEAIRYNKSIQKRINININPLTSPGEGVTVFISPYLSVGAPALGEAKGLIIIKLILKNIHQ